MTANDASAVPMIAVAEPQWAPRSWPAWRFLRDELALSPSRWAKMVRITAIVTLVTIVSNALQVPNLALSGFLIFLVAGSDAATTLRVGAGAIVGVTMALALALVFYSLTLGEPALRVPLMACVLFAGMYFMRSSAAGPLAFVIGFVTTYSLTFGDSGASPEQLTRSLLWTWVVVAYPIALLIILDVAIGRRPADVFREGIAARLEAAAEFLGAAAGDDSSARMRVERLERAGTGDVVPYVKDGPPSGAAARVAILRQVDLLLLLLRELPAEAKCAPQVQRWFARARDECRAARRALLGEECVPLMRLASLEIEPPGPGTPSAAALAVVLPLLQCVNDLGLTIFEARNPSASEDRGKAGTETRSPGASASASKKTEAVQFASKVTIAAMTAYIIYTGLVWSGIHTAMLTCILAAQDTVGATIHKLTLRIIGAVIGAVLGIAAIVFVLPQLESIGGLAVLVATVTLFAAWIATGRQAISYAGLQVAFAFYLTVLQGFSRTSKMVVGRDRLIGILLGNLIMSVIFTVLWPVRIKPTVRQALSHAVEALAAMIRLARGQAAGAGLREAEIAFHTHLRTAAQYASVQRMEPGDDDACALRPEIESLFVCIHAIVHQSLDVRALPPAAREALSAVCENVASRLVDLAAAIAVPRPIPAFHSCGAAVERPEHVLGKLGGESDSSAPLRLRVEWFGLLNEQLERFAAHQRGLFGEEARS